MSVGANFFFYIIFKNKINKYVGDNIFYYVTYTILTPTDINLLMFSSNGDWIAYLP